MVAWQSDKLESKNILKFFSHFFLFLVHLVERKQAIHAELCKFAVGQSFLPVCIAVSW